MAANGERRAKTGAGDGKATGPGTGKQAATKRIVLFSDGTGNSSSKLFKTNVWRLYDALDVDPVSDGQAATPGQSDQVPQVAFYDDGVGTSSFKPLAALGGALGVGLARNVRDIYAFLCRNYRDGDDIYGFGFSRGAFTMRVVAGLICHQGVIRDFEDEADLQRKVAAAYRIYRAKVYGLNSFMAWLVYVLRQFRDGVIGLRNLILGYQTYDPDKVLRPDITFLGLWDTVDAYGLPMDEMTAAWDQYIWPLTMRDYILHRKVKRARHVLALDDERQTFHPRLWEHDPADSGKACVDERRIAQVWFAGVHSNVGGGYPNDTLSFVSLNWMIARIDIGRQHTCEGQVFGLRFHPNKIALYRESADILGPIYDSRSGTGGYYRYQPRRFAYLTRHETKSPIRALAAKIFPSTASAPAPTEKTEGRFNLARVVDPGLQLVHHSVFDRIAVHSATTIASGGAAAPLKAGYAPLTVESDYRVVGPDSAGAPIIDRAAARYESNEEAEARKARVEGIYDMVWLRRITYFATLFFTGWLAAFPLLYGIEKTEGNDPTLSTIISEVPRAIATFLPGFLKPWIDAYAANPHLFLKLVAAVAGLLWFGGFLAGTIRSLLEHAWRQRIDPKYWFWWPAVGPVIHWVRTAGLYSNTLRFGKIWLLPAVFAALFYHLGSSLLNRVVFALWYDEPTCVAAFHPARPFRGDGDVIDLSRHADIPKSSEQNDLTRLYEIRSMCWGSGITLEGGRRYELTLEALRDGDNLLVKPGTGSFLGLAVPDWLRPATMKADLYGFNHKETGLGWFRHLWMQVIWSYRLPMRRDLFEPWFSQHVRVGAAGRDTQPLFPKVPPKAHFLDRNRLVAEFTARRDGEMFLFTNEAVGRFGKFDHYYKTNTGRIKVTVRQLDWDAGFSRH